mmetsp:Transcript_1530/g.3198  ORF Transcript_1530/g.3198 Transcript_1530/m.3198 type:complete len:161 (-) Transcript_1530:1398-1880(-)
MACTEEERNADPLHNKQKRRGVLFWTNQERSTGSINNESEKGRERSPCIQFFPPSPLNLSTLSFSQCPSCKTMLPPSPLMHTPSNKQHLQPRMEESTKHAYKHQQIHAETGTTNRSPGLLCFAPRKPTDGRTGDAPSPSSCNQERVTDHSIWLAVCCSYP